MRRWYIVESHIQDKEKITHVMENLTIYIGDVGINLDLTQFTGPNNWPITWFGPPTAAGNMHCTWPHKYAEQGLKADLARMRYGLRAAAGAWVRGFETQPERRWRTRLGPSQAPTLQLCIRITFVFADCVQSVWACILGVFWVRFGLNSWPSKFLIYGASLWAIDYDPMVHIVSYA